MAKTAVATKSSFEKKCEKLAKETGVDVDFYHNETYQDPFEDDGNLHVINKDGTRASFDIGQDTPSSEYNETTRKIMIGLGLTKHITDRVLVKPSRDDDPEDSCPHCGKPY